MRRIELVLGGEFVEAGVRFPRTTEIERSELAAVLCEGQAPFPSPFDIARARAVDLIECDRATLADTTVLIAGPTRVGILATRNRRLLGLRAFRGLAMAALLARGGAFVAADSILLAAIVAAPPAALAAAGPPAPRRQPWLPSWFLGAWTRGLGKKL